jgi:hypothetical protein
MRFRDQRLHVDADAAAQRRLDAGVALGAGGARGNLVAEQGLEPPTQGL